MDNKETLQEEKAKETKVVGQISFDDFAKVHLCVGEVLSCVPIEGSRKLYKMEVDLGECGRKQILAGLQKFFKPEDLVGKQGVFVANLAPRKMLDYESQGMMLLAGDENCLSLVTVSVPVKNGTRLS